MPKIDTQVPSCLGGIQLLQVVEDTPNLRKKSLDGLLVAAGISAKVTRPSSGRLVRCNIERTLPLTRCMIARISFAVIIQHPIQRETRTVVPCVDTLLNKDFFIARQPVASVALAAGWRAPFLPHGNICVCPEARETQDRCSAGPGVARHGHCIRSHQPSTQRENRTGSRVFSYYPCIWRLRQNRHALSLQSGHASACPSPLYRCHHKVTVCNASCWHGWREGLSFRRLRHA